MLNRKRAQKHKTFIWVLVHIKVKIVRDYIVEQLRGGDCGVDPNFYTPDCYSAVKTIL